MAKEQMKISEPPIRLSQMLRWVGPGMIVAAAAVGSGEIINATRLGAIAGLTVLWVVFWGVFLKGFIQQEIGRYTLTTRKTITEGFADIPGPKIYGKSWFLWVFLILLALVVLVIVAGIGGAIGGVLHILLPGLPASTWGIIANIAIIPILLIGMFIPKWNVYGVVERLMTIIVVGMTLLMLYIAFIALPFSDYSYSFGELIKGMAFQMPEGAVLVSLAVLGTVGAGIELIYYSTWLISKGFVKQAYHQEDDEAQRHERMKAWINVLKLDTWISVTATFLVTLSYFITGAVILKTLNVLPEGVNVVADISKIFTEILGPGYFVIFLLGSFAGLYTTSLGIADGTARMVVDLRKELTKKPLSEKSANILYAWSVVIVVLSWIIFYRFISAPTFLITIGGAALSLLFPLYGLALLYLNRQVPKAYRMSWIVKIILLICFFLFTSLWFVDKFF